MAKVCDELSENEKVVIRERHFGWEKAPAALLALVFGVSRQRIAAILKESEG